MVRHVGYAAMLAAGSLIIGMLGFHFLAAEGWSDSLVNGAMLLGGMGPVGDLIHISLTGKIFAAAFALYAGLVFITVSGLIAAPVFHRILHRYHWQGQSK